MLNVVVVDGCLARPAEVRTLPSGVEVLGFDVTVGSETGPAESVPVAWTDPPAWARRLGAGAGVVVVGRVRRRFFRAGGATQSRTEVVAEAVVPATSTRRVRTALARAVAAIEADGAPGPG